MENKKSVFPWDQWMAIGFGILRHSPESFWKMTPHELNAAIKGLYGPSVLSTPPTRKTLQSLISKFPD
ncbi:MAG: phage tail assembly chaperone [Methyloligellaceae bacterium]